MGASICQMRSWVRLSNRAIIYAPNYSSFPLVMGSPGAEECDMTVGASSFFGNGSTLCECIGH